MAYNITTSIFGRRFGLNALSSGQTGGSFGPDEYLVGPSGFRSLVTTADTTSAGVRASGIAVLTGTSVASTPVYVLDPPIRGVKKTIVFSSTDSAIYVRTKNAEYIVGSSLGSSATVVKSSGGGAVELMGLSTSQWAALNISSTVVNVVAFQATT